MSFEWTDSTSTLTYLYQDTTTIPIITQYQTETFHIIVNDGFTIVPNSCFSKFTHLQTLQLPDSIISFGNNFIANTQLKTLNIPLNLQTVSEYQSFDYQSTLEQFTVTPGNKFFATFDGVLYSKDFSALYFYPSGKKSKIAAIPPSVATIKAAAFGFNSNLEIIILPPSITKIELCFGYNLTNLKRVIILHCSSENEMKEQIEWDHNELFRETDFTYEQIEWIYQSTIPFLSSNGTFLNVIPNLYCPLEITDFKFDLTAFHDFDTVQSVAINQNVTSIGDNTFENCRNLSRISFPESIKEISPTAFSGTNQLKQCSSIFYPLDKYDLLSRVFSKYSLSICPRITQIISKYHFLSYHIFTILLGSIN